MEPVPLRNREDLAREISRRLSIWREGKAATDADTTYEGWRSLCAEAVQFMRNRAPNMMSPINADQLASDLLADVRSQLGGGQ